MATLYDNVCLRAFPDDAAVTRQMDALHARALSAVEMRIFLHDDPGHGWRIADGEGADDQFIVTIEHPPYHACSVRRQTTGGLSDGRPYRVAQDGYAAANAGFTAIAQPSFPMGDRISTMFGLRRVREDGQVESLYRFAVSPADPADPHHYGVEIRYVHQFHAADVPD